MNNTVNECPICFYDVTLNDNFVLCTKCRHHIHLHCFNSWTKQSNSIKCIYCNVSDNVVYFETNKPKQNKIISCLKSFKNKLISKITGYNNENRNVFSPI